MAIKTLIIQGYRSIQTLRLSLSDINVVTGANGSGKSNLYKAIYLLAKAVEGDLAKTLALEGGMPSILWAGKKKSTQSQAPVRLTQSESVLAQLQDPHLYPELFALSNEIKKWRFYHHFRTDPESPIRSPQIGVRTVILSNDGHNLAAAIQTIIEIGHSELLHTVIDRAFPGSKLLINVDNKTRFEIQLQMPGILRPLEARELSAGTLRYLCLVAALLSPRPAELLALNEPEMSLHPDLMQPLAELIVLAAKQSQIWVTTHSLVLAQMIEKVSTTKSISLIRTEEGTKIEGLTPWERLI